MKNYETPKMSVELFDKKDVIITSPQYYTPEENENKSKHAASIYNRTMSIDD